jgi:hypothetical protein
VPAAYDLGDTKILYSESSGRFIVTVDPAKQVAFEKIFSGMKTGMAGAVSGSLRFRIKGKDGSTLINEDITRLKDSWEGPFGGLI